MRMCVRGCSRQRVPIFSADTAATRSGSFSFVLPLDLESESFSVFPDAGTELLTPNAEITSWLHKRETLLLSDPPTLIR